MVIHGQAKNGVVVLPEGAPLVEGQAVTVFVPPPAPPVEARTHSILDIAPVSLGSVLHPLSSNDDLLGEMLEGR